jgi:hypothetical protein
VQLEAKALNKRSPQALHLNLKINFMNVSKQNKALRCKSLGIEVFF